MKKELTIAIIIGFFLGLAIAVGSLLTDKNFNYRSAIASITGIFKQTKVQPTPIARLTPTPAPQGLSLTILEPESHAIIKQEKVTVAGKTSPDITIVILYEEGEKILQTDENGNFSTEITLIGGANEVTISAYGKDGSQISQNLALVYSTAKI